MLAIAQPVEGEVAAERGAQATAAAGRRRRRAQSVAAIGRTGTVGIDSPPVIVTGLGADERAVDGDGVEEVHTQRGLVGARDLDEVDAVERR